MKINSDSVIKKLSAAFSVFGLAMVLFISAQGASKLSPALENQISGLANNAPVGVAIISFKTSSGLKPAHLTLLQILGVNKGVMFPTLGMVGAPLTAGQIRALVNNSSVASVWSNDRLKYYMAQARVMTGADRVRSEAAFTLRNGGMPVTGSGDFSVFVIDSGIDATHADLPFGTKVIQNTQRIVSTDTGNTGITIGGIALNGLTPSLSLENIPNTDTVGHGTHCAGIVGGLGVRSGANDYGGVAPGAKIVGSGGGAVILVLDALAGWEWGLANQDRYKIRVITNSYGPLGGGEYDENHPFIRASKLAYERNITVLFAGGNDGEAKNTLSPYAQSPWTIGVAAGTKEGMLAGFSSRGVPRSERLGDDNPNNDNAAPTLTAPGSGRYFEGSLARYGFTTDIISVRALTNLSSNGTTADAELPVGMIPFYTQISGTSMATPFAAGVVALMLDADPTLTPGEIRQILTETATKMPGYDDFEVGAGYINAYAAVDKIFNRGKNYKNFSNTTFNVEFGEERAPVQPINIDFSPEVEGANSTNAIQFTVEEGTNVLDVFAEADNASQTGTGNLVGIRITSPGGAGYSTAINTPVIGTLARQIVVLNPEPGTWTLEVRGARSLAAAPQASSPVQLALPGPVTGSINQIKYILPGIADIAAHPQRAEIEAALKNRVIDVYADGNFYPNRTVTREDLARSLVLNAPLRQSLGATPKFTDVSGDLANIAESLTANGSSLRDFNFVPEGLMSASDNLFNPSAAIKRLDLAVALVRALGRDAEARNLAGTDVTFEGNVIADNAQIPLALRGYAQIAVSSGLFETFPGGVVEIAPGQFQVVPGPRFEPNQPLNRAAFAIKLDHFRQGFRAGI